MSSEREGMVPETRLCRHKGDRGECLAPDCNCPPRTVPAPSDEGKRWTVYLYPNGERSMALSSVPNTRAVEVMPVSEAEAREAEVRAEERAATLREVERALNRWQAEAEQIGHHSLVDAYKAVRGALAAHFNPEADR